MKQEIKDGPTFEPLEQNCYNRLKPEIAMDLDKIASRFPVIYKIIKNHLTEHDNYFELPFDCAYMMNVYLKVDLNNFSRCFKHD